MMVFLETAQEHGHIHLNKGRGGRMTSDTLQFVGKENRGGGLRAFNNAEQSPGS